MIEISHKQARHLLREGVDRRLPDEQWAMLQAHLECCPACSAYRDRLRSAEKDLRHALRLRWGGARGPRPGIAEMLSQRRARAERRRKFLARRWWALLAPFLLAGWIAWRILLAPPPLPPIALPTPTDFLQPGSIAAKTGPPEQKVTFRGLVAYEDRSAGNAEIYLLNASAGRVDITNLTQDPAEDTSPAWSPDGEWIAFLSNRSGKNEVYLLSVAGSRLTQITSDPRVDWQGPLEWSADGKYLALTGRRAGAGFLYLAPLDGSAPWSIGLTRGAQPWARFSSTLPLLAYVSSSGLTVMNVETGWRIYPTWEDTTAFNFKTAQDGAFDWSPGGRSLVYVADGPYGRSGGLSTATAPAAMLRISHELDARVSTDILMSGADTIDRLPAEGLFRAVSWEPASLQVAALQDASGTGCWTVRLNHASNRMIAPDDLKGLCVEGGLERSNWTSNGNWLVLLARRPEEKEPGIYAMRLPSPDGATPALIERLADARAQAPPVEGWPAGPALRVRPLGRSLGLIPRAAGGTSGVPASAPPTALPPANLPGQQGWLAYNVDHGGSAQIFRARPDGSGVSAVTDAGHANACPRIGPDGRTAFVSDLDWSPEGFRDVYLMDTYGGIWRLTNIIDTKPTTDAGQEAVRPPSIGCPVWSPDGTRLVATVSYDGGPYYLAVIPVDRKTPPKYLQIERPSAYSAPVWLPAAGQVLLVYPQSSQPARLVSIDVDRSEDRQRVDGSVRSLLISWDDAWGLTISPDGSRLALFLLYNINPISLAGTIAQLRVMDIATMDVLAGVSIPNIDPYSIGQGGLGWLPDGRVSIVRTIRLVGEQKSVFEVFDPAGGQAENRLETVQSFGDVIYHAAWGDGWVIVTAESGLWAVQVVPAGETRHPPAQLNSEPVSEVDWR